MAGVNSSFRLQVLALYKQLIRESQNFNTYNYRTYAIRRTKDAFREHQHEKDPKKCQEFLAEAEKNLQLIKRQAVLGNLYSANKLIIETTGNLPQGPENSHAPVPT